MATAPLPDTAYLHKILKYEPRTGRLFWRRRKFEARQKTHGISAWNATYAGKEAFTHFNKGRLSGNIMGRQYAAHRIIWKMVYGDDPVGVIDHVNGDPTDNRIANLRECTQTDNMRNQGRSVANKSGVTGVSWYPRYSRWEAKIDVTQDGKRKRIYLGRWHCIGRAIAVRREAEREYGFHHNHGKRSSNRLRYSLNHSGKT